MRVFILLCTILVFLGLAFVFFTADAPIEEDAYISFRYCQSACAGDGLAFNPGEKEEGYSNLLWILILAIPYSLGLPLPVAAYILGMLSALALLVYLNLRVHPVSALLLATTVPFLHWSQHGLETVFYTLLITVSVVEICQASRRQRIWATVPFALAVFTRPEAPLLFAAAALAGLVVARRRRESGRPWWASIVLMAVAILVLEAWRILYHGDPLPNPFYAKQARGSLYRGLAYTLEFFYRSRLWYLLAFPLAYAITGGRGEKRLAIAGAVIAAQFFFVIVEGGDQMSKPYFRFFIPILPLLYVVAGWCLESFLRKADRGRPVRRTAMLALVGLGFGSLNAFGYVNRLPASPDLHYGAFAESLQRAVHNNTNWREIRRFFGNPNYMPDNFHTANARWIRENCAPGSVIAHDQMGQTPYYAGREYTFIDLFGLVTRDIAKIRYRHGGDYRVPEYAAYVMSRNPDYIMSFAYGHLHALGFRIAPTDPAMPPSPLTDRYRFLRVITGPRGGRTFVFARRDHLPAKKHAGD